MSFRNKTWNQPFPEQNLQVTIFEQKQRCIYDFLRALLSLGLPSKAP